MSKKMPIYLDCNATTPVEPLIIDQVKRFMAEEYGNAGSRTHGFGTRAKKAITHAREQVAAVVDARPDEVVFTSGATESNNIAILGLVSFAQKTQRNHVLVSRIEHKAVLEPMDFLARQGFEVEYLPVTASGTVDPECVRKRIRKDTLLVSIMHANNETGTIQPIPEIAEILLDTDAYFHVDAAQGFGKRISDLRNKRIDLISISGHKVYAPKGVGALVTRFRLYERPPLQPLMFGGGQERGLRPGTLPVALIVGLGVGSELAQMNWSEREAACLTFREKALKSLLQLNPVFNGDLEKSLTHTLNFSVPGLDSEAVMVALKEDVAISNGSACTSQSYTPSHVLVAMGVPLEIIQGAIRVSWCHMTEDVDWDSICEKLKRLM